MIDFTNIEISENPAVYEAAIRMDEVNDTIVICPATPVLGVSAITGFSVDVEGDVRMTFRYSLDEGLNWSDAEELSDENLSEIEPKKNHWLCIEVTITNLSGESLFKGIDFSFEYEQPPIPSFYKNFNYSSYIPYYNHFCIDWALNQLEKVYKRGIIPKFIERSDNAAWDDEDYINFWYFILYISALRIWCVDVLNDMLWNPKVLRNWLISKGLEIGTNIHMDELYYLMTHFYDEIFARGSIRCFEKYEDLSGNFTDAIVRGELMRIVNGDENDEFLAALISSDEQGWIIGYSSACNYINTDYLQNFTKGWENSISDLDNYPLYNESHISLSGDEIIIKGGSNYTGIGRGSSDKAITVNINRDYFFVVRYSCEKPYVLDAGCQAFDNKGGSIDLQTIYGDSENYWVSGSSYQPTNGDVLFYGEIRNEMSSVLHRQWPASELLRFPDNASISKIEPFFLVQSEGDFIIKDIRFGFLPEKPVYLSSAAELYVALQNNNPEYDSDSLKELIEQKLLPVGLALELDVVNEVTEDNLLDIVPTEIIIPAEGGTVEGFINTIYEFEIIEQIS